MVNPEDWDYNMSFTGLHWEWGGSWLVIEDLRIYRILMVRKKDGHRGVTLHVHGAGEGSGLGRILTVKSHGPDAGPKAWSKLLEAL
jgi:hypothetical protein